MISSVISGIIANAYKANGGTELGSNEWSDGKGLDLYETTFRSYNAQTGRFMQVDPLMESSANFSGYAFGLDNPATFIDPLGLVSAVLHRRDYTQQWINIISGFNSGDNNSWSPEGGYQWINEETPSGSAYSFGSDWEIGEGGSFGFNGSDDYHSSGGGGGGKKKENSINYEPGDGITQQNINKIKEGLISGETIALTFELSANATKGVVTVSTRNGLIKISATAAQYANLAKAFSNLGKAATVVEMYNSYHEYNNGEISGGRLAYRLTGGSASLLSDMLANALLDGELGAETGPWGAVIGIVVGLATPLGEIFYDKVLVPAADKTDNWLHEFIIDPIAHFESSLENWHP